MCDRTNNDDETANNDDGAANNNDNETANHNDNETDNNDHDNDDDTGVSVHWHTLVLRSPCGRCLSAYRSCGLLENLQKDS